MTVKIRQDKRGRERRKVKRGSNWAGKIHTWVKKWRKGEVEGWGESRKNKY